MCNLTSYLLHTQICLGLYNRLYTHLHIWTQDKWPSKCKSDLCAIALLCTIICKRILVTILFLTPSQFYYIYSKYCSSTYSRDDELYCLEFMFLGNYCCTYFSLFFILWHCYLMCYKLIKVNIYIYLYIQPPFHPL